MTPLPPPVYPKRATDRLGRGSELDEGQAAVTTTKNRCTIYLTDTRPLDDLVEELRRLAPLEARGKVSRSTTIEGAVGLALADLREHGRESTVFKTLVTSPEAKGD